MHQKDQQEILIQMHQQLSYVQTCVCVCVCVCERERERERERVCRWESRLPVDFKDDKVLP